MTVGPADAALALLMRPVRHAVNNLSMVLSANLDSAIPKLPAGERVTAQVTRARAAGEEYDRIVRGFLSLARDETVRAVGAERLLRDLLPLLALAAGGPLALDAGEGVPPTATIRARSPALDAALVLACAGGAALPSGPRPALRIRGAWLELGWPLTEGAAGALAAVGATTEATPHGACIGMPTA